MNSLARPQRQIATMAFLLASFLEICGCNPARTCEQLRATRLSAIPWETLLDQCAACLSVREMSVLRQTRESTVTNNLSSVFLHDATIQESLGEMHGPSFNNPGGEEPRVPISAIDGNAAGSAAEAHPEMEPIAWPIPQSVLFVYAAAPSLGETPQRIATAFILSVSEQRGLARRYLVTARHVVDPEWARCGQLNPRTLTVRFNRRSGGVEYRSIALGRKEAPQFITSRDDTMDLALVPLNRGVVPDLDSFRLAEIAFDSLPTRLEVNALRKAQQIVTAGVSPAKLWGLTDFPVSQSGVIATAATAATVDVRCGADSPQKAIQMWLIDASVERGVSGAPVYAALTRGPHRLATPVLVGVQTVVWPDRGQAGITPVAALRELVEQERNTKNMAVHIVRNSPPG